MRSSELPWPRQPMTSGGPQQHQPAQPIDGGLVAIERGHNLPAKHHEDPITEVENLVEILGQQQYRGPLVSGLDQALVYVVDRFDVDATGRLPGKDNPGPSRQLPTHD